jgi:hypothetical protein
MIAGSNPGVGWEFFSSPLRPHWFWLPGALSLGIKRPGREADHSPPSSAEVKNVWTVLALHQNAFMAWFSVIKAEEL